MKTWRQRVLIVLTLMVCLAPPTWAQMAQQGSGTAVTPTATTGLAATRCDSVTGATPQTLTLLNPGPGLSDYITLFIVNGEATGTVTAAAPIAITTTNITGTSPTFGSLTSLNATAQTIGALFGPGPMPLGQPVKGNSGTAPTFTLTSAPANDNLRMTACYYVAP